MEKFISDIKDDISRTHIKIISTPYRIQVVASAKMRKKDHERYIHDSRREYTYNKGTIIKYIDQNNPKILANVLYIMIEHNILDNDKYLYNPVLYYFLNKISPYNKLRMMCMKYTKNYDNYIATLYKNLTIPIIKNNRFGDRYGNIDYYRDDEYIIKLNYYRRNSGIPIKFLGSSVDSDIKLLIFLYFQP
jgi:hypothetical protein